VLSIIGRDFSYWTAPELMTKRFYDLLGFTDLGRRWYFYSTVDLRREPLQKIDSLIRATLAKVDGELEAKYSSLVPGARPVVKDYLEELLGSHELEDTLHDLRFKFKKGKCQVHLILSRRKVQLRFNGGPEHESLKRSLKKSVEGVLKKNKAHFLKHLLFLTLFMFVSFGLMWGADLGGAKFSIRVAFNVVAILSTFVLLPLIGAHYKGGYLPHTTITLAEAKKAKKALTIAEIVSLLSLLVEIVQLVKDWLQRRSASFWRPGTLRAS